MHTPPRSTAAVGLVVSGLAFAAYPLLRPYGPETGVGFAAHIASPLWVVAHVLGMVGFTALALALRALVRTGTPWRWDGRPLRMVETRMWLALALLLPYYGAEAYGLNAVGRQALGQDIDAGAVAQAFRYAPFELGTFAVGLVLVMLVGLRLVHGTWVTGGVTRLGGLLTGIGLVTYVPQFFAAPEVRMAHGVVLGLGMLVLAWSVAQPRSLRAGSTDRVTRAHLPAGGFHGSTSVTSQA
jgi:hypothetical protein